MIQPTWRSATQRIPAEALFHKHPVLHRADPATIAAHRETLYPPRTFAA